MQRLVILFAVAASCARDAAKPERCDPETGLGCSSCADDCAGAGLRECSAGRWRACESDGAGCLAWSAFTPCASGVCSGAESCAGCNDACAAVGLPSCTDGARRTCEQNAGGCLVWSFATACPGERCADAATCAPCSHACDTPGTSCDAGALAVCRLDANDCRATAAVPCELGCDAGACRSCAAPALAVSTQTLLPGSARDVDSASGLAYVALGEVGLAIVDVAAASLLAVLDTPGSGSGVAVLGSRVYVADGLLGVAEIDVTLPSAPQLLGSIATADVAWDVARSGAQLVVADGNAGLSVLTPPTLSGTVATGGLAQGVIAFDTRALILERGGAVRLIDVANPTTPRRLGRRQLGGRARAAALAGSRLYVADESVGLTILDIEGDQLAFAGGYDIPGGALGVTHAGSHALLADGSAGLWVIDVTVADTPALVRQLGLRVPVSQLAGELAAGSSLQSFDAESAGGIERRYLSPAQTLDVWGDRLYIGDGASLSVVDRASRDLLGRLTLPGTAQHVLAAEPYVYVAGSAAGLRVVDVRDPAHPKLHATIDTAGSLLELVPDGSDIFAADGSRLLVFDASDPAAPVQRGAADAPDAARSIAVDGALAAIAMGYGGIAVYDVANRDAPELLGRYVTAGYAYDVTFAAGLLFVADGAEGGLAILDVSNPEAPTPIGALDTPGIARRAVIHGAHAYVADQSGGFLIADVADPTRPILVARYPTGDAVDLLITGHEALVAVGSGGVAAVRLCPP